MGRARKPRAAPAPWARRFSAPRPARFYDRPTIEVARALLGAVVVRRWSGRWRAARLVETEAYVTGDPASHAYRGPTPRNRSMFGPPGTLYVFRIHQVHCANVVTRRGEAVLLRAAEPLTPLAAPPRGPGLFARAFGIDRRLDGSDVVRGPVRLLRGPRPPEPIVVGPRVGIRQAAERPLRFALDGSPWVSSPKVRRPTPLRGRRTP